MPRLPLSLIGLTAPLMLMACGTAENGEAKDSAKEPVATEAPVELEMATCPVIDSRNWTAVMDKKDGPDAPARLTVSGEVDLPTPGYSFEWKEGIADRSLRPMQQLILTFERPSGIVNQVIASKTVTYEGKAIAPQYRSIIVMCGGDALAEITDIQVAE